MKKCNKCGEIKDLSIFYIQKCINRLGERYNYYMPTCKSCVSRMNKKEIKPKTKPKTKKVVTDEKNYDELRNEIRYFIRKIIIRGGDVDEVDLYRILHYYQLVERFIWTNVGDSPIDEIKMNWERLLEWYEADKPLRIKFCKSCNALRSNIDMRQKKRCSFCYSKMTNSYRLE